MTPYIEDGRRLDLRRLNPNTRGIMGEMRGPSYMGLVAKGELRRRADVLDAMLAQCTVCPHRCGVDRFSELGECATGSKAVVASWTPHFGEESVISGHRGSGTVFLANCNLRCVFCQNHQISQRPKNFLDQEISDEVLAEIFLDLQRRGCHNLNWVSPSHQAPQLVRGLDLAAQRGLRLPVVYNSNGYDSVEVLRLLDGVVDIYMPDLKYSDTDLAAQYSRVPEYPGRARAAIEEMSRQVGAGWHLDADDTLDRGLLIRLLVLPHDVAGVADSLQWIAETLASEVRISLLAQYHPQHLAARTDRYPLLARTILAGEWTRAVEALERTMKGAEHCIQGPVAAAESNLPL